jgi:hypothetical protein
MMVDPRWWILGGMMKATAKLTFLVAIMATTTRREQHDADADNHRRLRGDRDGGRSSRCCRGSTVLNREGFVAATNGRAPPFGTPAAPCDQNGPLDPPGSDRCPGYTEIYGFLRNTLGWNQLSGTKAFSSGPLTNIEFAFGVDANTDNTTLGSAKRSIQAGLRSTSRLPTTLLPTATRSGSTMGPPRPSRFNRVPIRVGT